MEAYQSALPRFVEQRGPAGLLELNREMLEKLGGLGYAGQE